MEYYKQFLLHTHHFKYTSFNKDIMKIFLRIGTDTNVFWGDYIKEWEYFEDDEMIFL